ncbi:MAG: response regulator [Nitrosomonadales bacterium]|nr:response regulator [Nitrosomonadales bacterium]
MAKTVLNVDDSTSIRQMVVITLKDAGYEVIEAADGQEGLDIARVKTVDLVLTDLNMPRMNGLAMTMALRAMSSYRDVPILILTTESGDEMKKQGKAAGATGWMIKPFDPQKLLEVVRKVIG